MERKVVATVSIPGDKFPWFLKEENGKMRRYYDDSNPPMSDLKGQPMSFGYSNSSKNVEFMFFEGCDLNKVMMFKLTWGGA